MKKILIAIGDNFVRRIYSEVFIAEKFEVLDAKNGKEALDLAKREAPDMILADISLTETSGLELLGILKGDVLTQKIPVIIFTQSEREGDRRKAVELEAKDFVVGVFNSPAEVVLRVKAHFGEEKSYKLAIDRNAKDAKELAMDLKYNPELICPNCKTPVQISLMRDLSKGKNYFKVSFVCPKCYQSINE